MRFLNRIDRNVSRTGHGDCLSLDIHAVDLKKLFRQVQKAIPGGLRPCQRAAVAQSLSGEHAFIKAPNSLILPEQVTNLSCPCSDVPGRNVRISADIFAKLCHKALAESHNLPV